EIVTITGAGWQSGETVTLDIQEDPPGNPGTTLSATADADGNILNTEFALEETDAGLGFILTATGLSSGSIAQTTFTDTGGQVCTNDLQGPDDEPGQKDLNQFCQTFGLGCGTSGTTFTWNFDDTD